MISARVWSGGGFRRLARQNRGEAARGPRSVVARRPRGVATRRRWGDRGMVTAEIAVALPAVVVLLGGLIALVVAVGAQMRCIDAAREGARAAARGDPAGQVIAVATRAAPAGAQVSVAIDGEYATVTVTAATTPLGGLLGPVAVSATASSRIEPDSNAEGTLAEGSSLEKLPVDVAGKRGPP